MSRTTCIKCRQEHDPALHCGGEVKTAPPGPLIVTPREYVLPARMHAPKQQVATRRICTGTFLMDGNGKRLGYEFITVKVPK